MDSIYWVLSRNCNQRCAHCYNDSEPGAMGLDEAEALRCVEQLPAPDTLPIGRVILSGGEVLVWKDMLLRVLDALHARLGKETGLWVQTNGDLLDGPTLDELLEHHVCRVDVSSMDRFHLRKTLSRRGPLEELFLSRGLVSADALEGAPPEAGTCYYKFWGATPDTWIGPLWPRGRARQSGVSTAAPEHRFCEGWSGAKGFLDYHAPGSEVNIQLADVYPCCPMTAAPIGILLEEPLLAILDRCAGHSVFQKLNLGCPEAMGVPYGFPGEYGFERSRVLGNHCLWCDEFFVRHAPELLRFDARTARGGVDLVPPKKKGKAE